MIDDARFYSTTEAADLLSVSPSYVRFLCGRPLQEGGLPNVRIGSVRRIPGRWLRAYVLRRQGGGSADGVVTECEVL